MIVIPSLLALTGTLPALTGTVGFGLPDCGAGPEPPPDPEPPDAAQASPGIASTAPAANSGVT